jgi:hypothetical protein
MSEKSVNFHIKSGDYFGTLATVLSLIRQSLGLKEKRNAKILENLEKDLLFLQKRYRIVKK